jgi:anti-sigma B factor antagonist
VTQRSEAEPPPPGLDILRRVVDGTLVVAVTGEVDLDTARLLHTAITAAIDRSGGGPCVVDLTAVTFLDSAGLTALLQAASHPPAHHDTLRIVVDSNRPVIRPIEITGLDDELKLYHTVDEALNANKA